MSRSRRRQSGESLVGGAVGLVLLSSLVSSNSEGVSKALSSLLGGLLILGITAASVWVAWRLWRRLRTPRARELSECFEAVHSMSGTQFEVFMAERFRALGHKTVILGEQEIGASTSSWTAAANASPCSARTTRRCSAVLGGAKGRS